MPLSKEMLAAIRAELAGPAEKTLRSVEARRATYPEKKPRKTIKALADMKVGRSSFHQATPTPDPDNTFDALCREHGVAVRADYFTQDEYEDARK